MLIIEIVSENETPRSNVAAIPVRSPDSRIKSLSIFGPVDPSKSQNAPTTSIPPMVADTAANVFRRENRVSACKGILPNERITEFKLFRWAAEKSALEG
jgi:hypothetical protein